MGCDDLKTCAGVDGLERNPVVFRIIAPSPGLIGPDDATALDPASIRPDETVDGPRVGQEENVAFCQGDLDRFRIAVLDCCNRSPANRFGMRRAERQRATCVYPFPAGESRVKAVDLSR